MNEFALIIGQRIRNYRTQNGLTQAQLAELAECESSYIGQLERGEKNATIKSIAKIASALHVPLSQLFDKLGEQNNQGVNYPLLCYEIVASKELPEQKRIYRILSEINYMKEQ